MVVKSITCKSYSLHLFGMGWAMHCLRSLSAWIYILLCTFCLWSEQQRIEQEISNARSTTLWDSPRLQSQLSKLECNTISHMNINQVGTSFSRCLIPVLFQLSIIWKIRLHPKCLVNWQISRVCIYYFFCILFFSVLQVAHLEIKNNNLRLTS